MDKEDKPLHTYNQVSPLEISLEEDDRDEEEDFPIEKTQHQLDECDDDGTGRFLYKTFLPDDGISIGSHQLVEGTFTIKLLKFIAFTFISIALVHLVVANVDILGDRDRNLKLTYIWTYEGNLIVYDSVIFFLIGRLWRQKGVDHLAWVFPVLVCNLYFESQQFFSFLQNSVSLYSMHCIWPWELWAFVGVLIPMITALVLCHILRAYKKRLLLLKIMELLICGLFFLLPYAGSSYFHFHHWFAGWLIGMHCNLDLWWSRAAMAWCWGMYINGIAVYGRDPVLTCEYAYFLSMDNRCPYMECYTEAMKLKNETGQSGNVTEMIPVDWRNCSSEGFHP